MSPAFDIFLIEADETPLWLEAVATLEEAERRARELATPRCPRCLILDQRTGKKHILDTRHNLEVRPEIPA